LTNAKSTNINKCHCTVYRIVFIVFIRHKLIHYIAHINAIKHHTQGKITRKCALKATMKSNKSSAVVEMGDRRHNRYGPKRGGAAVPLYPRAGTPSNIMWPGSGSTSVVRTKWRLHPSSRLATIDMGRKLGRGLRTLFGDQSMILFVLQLTCWISYNKHRINLHNAKYTRTHQEMR